MGGVGCMDENIAACMINLQSKKWWWPLLRSIYDVSVNNALQLYRLKDVERGGNIDKSFETLFRGSRKLHKPVTKSSL